MTTTDERLTTLETEFRTELRHLATRADLKGEIDALVVVGGAVVAAVKFL